MKLFKILKVAVKLVKEPPTEAAIVVDLGKKALKRRKKKPLDTAE